MARTDENTVKPQPEPEIHDFGPFHRIGQDEETGDWWWETLDEGLMAQSGTGCPTRSAAAEAVRRSWAEYWGGGIEP